MQLCPPTCCTDKGVVMTWQVILVLMLLGHLVADYTLQGWLADGKQKKWWQNCFKGIVPEKYKRDYWAALYCHALYWSIFICAPFYASPYFIVAIAVNTLAHAIIDNEKANVMSINLIQDQLLHLVQILLTFGIMMVL